MRPFKKERKRINYEEFCFHGGKLWWGPRMPPSVKTLAQAMKYGVLMAEEQHRKLQARADLDGAGVVVPEIKWYVTRVMHDLRIETTVYKPKE